MWKESDTEGFEGYHFVQSGTLREDFERFKPDGEIFVVDRVSWLRGLDGVKQFQGSDANSKTE